MGALLHDENVVWFEVEVEGLSHAVDVLQGSQDLRHYQGAVPQLDLGVVGQVLGEIGVLQKLHH